MKLYIGNTDRGWFDFLAQRQIEQDVNFWRPSGLPRTFSAIEPGDLFFFRLKAPESKLAGYGTFLHHSVLPLMLAWDAFGEGNGCVSREDLIEMISKYRGESVGLGAALIWPIGCTVLTDLHYVAPDRWLDFPIAPGLVTGKSVDLKSDEGKRVWKWLQGLPTAPASYPIPPPHTTNAGSFGLLGEGSATYATGVTKVRIGQGSFRVMVLDAYGRRCCVTGEKALPAVEAAHIQPYSSQLSHHIQNGLSLRADVHSLFDQGYVTVDDDYHFVVSARLKDDFDNGEAYYRHHGSKISVPSRKEDRPSLVALKWHQENRFVG